MVKIRFVIVVALLSCLFQGRVQATTLLPVHPDSTSFQLVFNDEFEGNALDWNVWDSDDAIKVSASGQTVGRWKDNAVVADGLLKLMVYKGNRTDSQWTAGFVWVKELFGPNTYYETRFRVTNATGVNNAFWTSVQTRSDAVTRDFMNRYEIDVVEAKKLNTSNSITAHLAWHDWKTYSYAGDDIAQGISKVFSSIDFMTWGLWVGEDHFIIYRNGVEQWRGTTHSNYTNQWKTGVGKLPAWPTKEEKRAYGKWGQTDWNYMGGMNGDDMNICLSNMPWSVSNSTLTDAAHNSSMDVDYMRIFKRKADLVSEPVQHIEKVVVGEDVTIAQPLDLNADENYYFSFVIDRHHGSNTVIGLSTSEKHLINLKIAGNNELVLFDSESESTTALAYPAASFPGAYFENGKKYLFVGRITAASSEKDIFSIRTFELGKNLPVREPFLYRNIDNNGNTSITNEWSINKKFSDSGLINTIILNDDNNSTILSGLLIGKTYSSVVSAYLNKSRAYLSGQAKSSTERRIFIELEGAFPFDITYTDGKSNYTIQNITQSPHTFLVNPTGISEYTIVSARDAAGNSVLTGGSANFYVADDDFYTLRPSFDTYLTEGSTTNAHTLSDLFVTSKTGSAQESFLVFDLPQQLTVTEKAHVVLYYTSKSINTTTEFELLGSDELVTSATTWSTAPPTASWKSLGSKVTGGSAGYYIDFDVTSFCNEIIAANKRSFTLKLRQIIGDENALSKFKAGHNTTSSVPSFMVVSKKIQSATSDVQDDNQLAVCLNIKSRQLSNCSGIPVKNISLYDLTGRYLSGSNTLPYTIPGEFKGIVLAHIESYDKNIIQKLQL